jgi:hypothetical protein
MFCAFRLIWGGTEGVRSRFHVLRSSSRFRRYRGRRFPFTCFALPDSFWTEPRTSGPVCIFCAPELVIDGTEGVGSRFHVLRYRTRFGHTEGVEYRFHLLRSRRLFRRYRGRRVLFAFFALPDSFCVVPKASGPFLCFALPDSFWAVPRASGPVFMFCAPILVLGDTDGVGSRFNDFRSKTHLRRN